MEKRCTRCGESKPAGAFSPYTKSRDGLFSWCKGCNREVEKARYAKMSPEDRRLHNRHHRSQKAQDRSHAKEVELYRTSPERRAILSAKHGAYIHGITPEEYVALRSRSCAICGIHKDGFGRRGSGMHIDHDHATGKIRGVLCDLCNRGIGCLGDSADRLEAAVTYLRQWIDQTT